jgi:hypothetical protein
MLYDEACKASGVEFFEAPTSEVRSIAYDWRPGSYRPPVNYFEIDEKGNMSNLRSGTVPYPPKIEFIKNRCCHLEGPPLNKIGPYVRHVGISFYEGIPALTADALVTYESKPIEMDPILKITQYDVVVTDRRDSRPLAKLRYLVDAKNKRACGKTSDGIMDERAFVLKAVSAR